jgi:exodeoxyribonuclease V alpha subunit
METIQGMIIETKHRSEDYAVCSMRTIDSEKRLSSLIRLEGSIPGYDKQALVEVVGQWNDHPKYGRQFHVLDSYKVLPNTLEEFERYLSSNMPGVGPSKAKAIVDEFGDLQRLKEALDSYSGALAKVSGIGDKQAARIDRFWKEEAGDIRTRVFLAGHGFSKAMSRKIIEHFGSHTQEVLTKNPYLVTEVNGIGFKTADEAAKMMGWGNKSKERTEAACVFVLQESLQSGHTFVHLDQVRKETSRLAASEESEVSEALTVLNNKGRLVGDTLKGEFGTMEVVYLPYLLRAEKFLASKAIQLSSVRREAPGISKVTNLVIETVSGGGDIPLSSAQKRAVLDALTSPISIITGGPGTGKTQSVKALVGAAHSLGINFVLAAPTGRAAKRLSEVTGEKAFTLHRLLEFEPESGLFKRNSANPIEADILVVDEASMLDLPLAEALFSALPDNCDLVMIGDVDQLPAVGPGTVLKDLIESGSVPVTILDTIFRQAEGSLIIRNSHLIKDGKMPQFPPKGAVADSYFIPVPKIAKVHGGKKTDDIEWVKDCLIKLCQNHIPSKLKVDPVRDIQVLVPMRKNEAGTGELNKILQTALNPEGKPIELPRGTFLTGDRVMQTRNNYQLGLSNGDIGFVKDADRENDILKVDFYGNVVDIPYEDTGDLQLSYAQTIHKSQGSEYPVVIVVMLMQHYAMLDRNLLYTANTRAKKMCLYVASPGAIETAAKRSGMHKRNTFLAERIKRYERSISVKNNSRQTIDDQG